MKSETLQKIQEAALEEFQEKGYTKASLRQICKKAGVTTGALYFFFKDKDQLFSSLFAEVLEALNKVMDQHYEIERQSESTELLQMLLNKDSGQEDYKAIEEIMHIMYSHRQMLLLLLTKAQGSSLEHVEDQFIDHTTKHYSELVDKMKKLFPQVEVSPHLAHWISHQQIEGMVYALIHIEEEKEAKAFLDNMVSYMRNGWFSIWSEEQMKEKEDK
ncbi:MAG: TetR/AcrR family transcriptional regulator [Eubacterium sp.]|nr:TetR/AcrR family transcriptional regulator [Eubacterium sp.]